MTTITISSNNNNNANDLTKKVLSLLSRSGQIVTMTTNRPVKIKKGANASPINKESIFQCRIGVNYDNISAVKEKRVDGSLPEENAGLPWGKWVKFPFLIEHNGEFYLRCTTLKNSVKTKTKYVAVSNGNEVAIDDVKSIALASEFPKCPSQVASDIFNIKVSSIIDIKGV